MTFAPAPYSVRAIAPPIPPEAPVTSALFPLRSNIAHSSNRFQKNLNFGRRPDRTHGEVAIDALGKTAQDASRADLGQRIDAVFLHRQNAFAPTHQPRHLLDEESFDRVRIARWLGADIGHERN